MSIATVKNVTETAPAQDQQGRKVTVDEFLALDGDAYRHAELVDGEIVNAAPPLPPHSRFQRILCNLLEQHGLFTEIEGAVQVSRNAFGLGTVREMDVYVRRAEPFHAVYQPADLLLAVEVVSESSYRVDTEQKFVEYEKCGIPLYWIIELRPGPLVRGYRLTNGMYRLDFVTGGLVDTMVGGVQVRFDLTEIKMPRLVYGSDPED
jgi:Uma2 family endonuclease